MRNTQRILIFFIIIIIHSSLIQIQQIQSESLQSTSWIVDKDGQGDYISIQKAINNANDGDTITILEGIYYESLIINKTLSIKG